MRILILDDDQGRHLVLDGRHQGDEIVGTFTFDGAVMALTNIQEQRFDLFYLDRDLNDFEFESRATAAYNAWSELTGEDFAAWMLKNVSSDRWPKKVIVHSWSEDAYKIRDRLVAGGVDAILEEFKPRTPEEDVLMRRFWVEGRIHPRALRAFGVESTKWDDITEVEDD